tara:strand:+ start:659 stop:1102 length:444 start_codon:yes stop_codon:yes gene_type:complete
MLTKYADTLKRRGLDTCSSQILADVLESFPKAISVKQLAHNTGKTEKYIKSKVRAMKRDEVPIKLRRGSRNNYVETSLFEPVHWILKEKENAEMALEDLNSIKLNGDPTVNKKKRIVKRIYKEYLRDMNDLIDRWYSLRLIQSLKDD